MKKIILTYISTVLTIFIVLNYILVPKVKAITLDSSMDEKTIYLTFDDGPSVLTGEILDILNKFEVKGTFFLIGNQIKGQEEIVKRLHKEGHSIGLHTYTHEYKKIYSSQQRFISEMLTTQKIVDDLTGVKPNIIRFPFGSNKKLSQIFLNNLHNHNFKVYDWNLFMSDGINCKTPPYKLYKEATKPVESEGPVILLMHCDYTHKNTCKALPEVIKFYKDKGYEFKVIDETTPEHYFPLKKQV
ncbi:polysaccharide deacetylase family protein [Clostridium tunisiense]|uniref:polysaccharide deacetylase family protein n=1 Tax=Clostridium tunisiense TaxID=219748 RepID=UPI000315CE89|nr:polysaccharide deacetylase family protein [Clostridium tunisiense]